MMTTAVLTDAIYHVSRRANRHPLDLPETVNVVSFVALRITVEVGLYHAGARVGGWCRQRRQWRKQRK
jgi:hypothetical protein